MRTSGIFLVLALVVSTAGAQVTATVGPTTAPTGGSIAIAISNDTAVTEFTGVCPFFVTDGLGNTVYSPFCIAIVVTINPGDTFVTGWDQKDDFGQQVPNGLYNINLAVASAGLQVFPITIGGPAAAMTEIGAPRPGTSRNLLFSAPAFPNLPYIGGASLPYSSGILTCGGLVPVDQDPILTYSTTPGNGNFLAFTGTLSANGETANPAVVVPPFSGLSGLTLSMTFVVVDTTLACPIAAIAQPYYYTIL